MIDLTGLRCRTATPTLLDWASLQEPIIGGVTQRIGRLGSRYSIEFETPTMDMEADGRRAIALLQQAQRLGGRVEYPQPDFRIGAVGVPLADGIHAGGTTVKLKGLTPRYAVRQGQALNLVVAGRYYLYFAADNAVMNSSGAGSMTLTEPLRTELAGNETVELARPVIEGWLDGSSRSWTIDVARTTGLKFTITERA
jgi:hypothetical protein